MATLSWHPLERGEVPPGVVRMVTVLEGGAQLWRYEQVRRIRKAIPFEGKTAERIQAIASHVTTFAPYVLDSGLVQQWPHFGPYLEGDVGRRGIFALEGNSLELSALVSAVSRVMGLPVPLGVVASSALVWDSATKAPTGELQAVDGIEAKVARLAVASEPPVGRLLVHPGNREAAIAARDRCGAESRLEVVAVSTVAAALQAVFGDPSQLDSALTARWKHRSSELAGVLFRVASSAHQPHVRSWHGISKAADLVLAWEKEAVTKPSTAMLGLDVRQAHARAWLAKQIATRHAGVGADALIPLPDEETLLQLARPLRLDHLAHVVQSHNDAAAPMCLDVASRVEQRYLEQNPLERCEADLRLLGAIGRALVAEGELEAGAERLRAAVDGWVGILRESQASYPLCALYRILGLLRRRDELGALDDGLASRIAPRLDGSSRCWLALARGRAWALAGEAGLARECLGEGGADWSAARADVEPARLRWLARLGGIEATQASERLDGLARAAGGAEQGTPLALALALSRLDRAIARGEGAAAAVALAELEAAPNAKRDYQRIQRLFEKLRRNGESLASLVADWFED